MEKVIKYSIQVLIGLFPFFIYCQTTFKLENSFSVKADFFTTDNLARIYAVNGDELRQYSPVGKQMNVYSSKTLGEISFVDASNPLKIMLFYQSLSQVVFLDNTLSQQGDPVSLEEIGLEQVTLVCSSVNNGIWVYNQQQFQLARLDENLRSIAETGNIIQLIGDYVNPSFLLERKNWVYLNDPEKGILVFDIFGTYSKTIPVKNLSSFQVVENYLYYRDKTKLYKYDFKTLEISEVPLPSSEIGYLRVSKNKLLLLAENSLQVYTVEN
ncbi:MAG: hypothetical protein COA57_01885 [Flavobacteriales bacterium]|nr:MAG: hypothetical protein COA57_01885 [Flavobacteriales bacterium]